MELIKMDKITEAKLAVRHENWKRMYEDYQNSGMKVREWCSEQGISVKTFYYRLRVIREEMLKNDVVHEIVPITACADESQAVTVSTEATDKIRITGNGIEINMPISISPELMADILRGIR